MALSMPLRRWPLGDRRTFALAHSLALLTVLATIAAVGGASLSHRGIPSTRQRSGNVDKFEKAMQAQKLNAEENAKKAAEKRRIERRHTIAGSGITAADRAAISRTLQLSRRQQKPGGLIEAVKKIKPEDLPPSAPLFSEYIRKNAYAAAVSQSLHDYRVNALCWNQIQLQLVYEAFSSGPKHWISLEDLNSTMETARPGEYQILVPMFIVLKVSADESIPMMIIGGPYTKVFETALYNLDQPTFDSLNLQIVSERLTASQILTNRLKGSHPGSAPSFFVYFKTYATQDEINLLGRLPGGNVIEDPETLNTQLQHVSRSVVGRIEAFLSWWVETGHPPTRRLNDYKGRVASSSTTVDIPLMLAHFFPRTFNKQSQWDFPSSSKIGLENDPSSILSACCISDTHRGLTAITSLGLTEQSEG